MAEGIEVQVCCEECEGSGVEVIHDPGIPGFARARDVRVRCLGCRGEGHRWVRPSARPMCALCLDREADPTVAVFCGGLCCRACAEDIDAALDHPPCAEPNPLPHELAWVESDALVAGAAR